jgi:hypothetical protein
MRYQFGEPPQDKASRAMKIREAFIPGSTIQEHTEHCINLGIWSESELRAMAAREARNEVRAALGAITAEGVPFAGATPTRKGGRPVWRQMQFWSKADFDYNYSQYRRRAKDNEKVAVAIARVCRERFGEDPTYYEIEDEPE